MTEKLPPQPEALPQWQPIKTAPKDGTHILVWTDASDTAYVVCWADAAKGIRKYLTAESGAAHGWHLAWDGTLFDRELEPTHWMPLPAAPSALSPQPEAQPQLTAAARERIGQWLASDMAIAVRNGANSVSMPDELVEIAAWLCDAPSAQPHRGEFKKLDPDIAKFISDNLWDLAAPSAQAEPRKPDRTGMTYYKNNACLAASADSPDCICWTKTTAEQGGK